MCMNTVEINKKQIEIEFLKKPKNVWMHKKMT